MLDASCRGLAEYSYQPLTPPEYYLPPSSNHSGDLTCDCNTVMYSLTMACTSCQLSGVYSWLQWIPQCTSVYITQYPVNISQGTAVPHWAYYNWTSLPTETYNDTVAMSIGRDPEELPPRTTSVSGGTLTSGQPGPTRSSSPKNVGAIVGGVVGSVVPLTILGIILCLYIGKQRRRRARQQQPRLIPNRGEDLYQQRQDWGRPPPITDMGFPQHNPADQPTFPLEGLHPNRLNSARETYAGIPEVQSGVRW